MVDARLVIEAVEKARGNELDQIAVALVVLAQQHEMIRALGVGAAILVVVRRDVNFAADDRLYAVSRGLVVKIRGGEKIAVVGDGDRRHAAPRGLRGEFDRFRKRRRAENSPCGDADVRNSGKPCNPF